MAEKKVKELADIKCEPLEGYHHIFKLNGFKLNRNTRPFFKYMPLKRLVNSIEKQELVFVSPETWNDPYEKLFYNIDCSSHGYKTEDVACMCVTPKEYMNEEAAWKIYADQNEKAVRVTYDVNKFLPLLDKCAEENGYKIYIGQVIYNLDVNDIQYVIKKSSTLYPIYCPKLMKTEHYLSLLLIKRQPFAYENEIRIFIVKDKGLYNYIKGSYLKETLFRIKCDYPQEKIISKITVSPYKIEDSKTIIGNFYNDLHENEFDKIRDELFKEKLKLDCTIKKSHLYDHKGPKKID